ncbi:MAG: histidine--tRNA ligase [Streptococcaceae bacterium]|jgi:histidyl-tRNA synthetase|nr:histidine--tRNA ligase [Streptococcaceae bacterium]
MGELKKVQRPKGTSDLLPEELERWHFLEKRAREVFERYQFSEIRTPLFEHYEVFARTVGNSSDIVVKEMYDFYDKGERHIALRPEGTASIVRAFVENKLFGPEHRKPYKVYYMGPMFRYERPQAGRLRQFHQLGVEVFGSDNPATDVEIIAMLMDFFQFLGLKKIKLVINSLGDKEIRVSYREALISFLEQHASNLSQDSQRRLHENPLRVLDSKNKKDKEIVAGAPSILDYLNEESSQYFKTVTQMLDKLEIAYEVDPNMVRGLDYYNHTIFEVMSSVFDGAQTTIAAGGRYNELVEYFGGPETPGIGFGIGCERLLLTMDAEKIVIPAKKPLDVYIVTMGEETNLESLKLVQAIRQAGYSVERDFLNRKAKAQFKTADKMQARLIITIGENELADGVANVKNAKKCKEVSVPLQQMYKDFTEIYRKLVR